MFKTHSKDEPFFYYGNKSKPKAGAWTVAYTMDFESGVFHLKFMYVQFDAIDDDWDNMELHTVPCVIVKDGNWVKGTCDINPWSDTWCESLNTGFRDSLLNDLTDSETEYSNYETKWRLITEMNDYLEKKFRTEWKRQLGMISKEKAAEINSVISDMVLKGTKKDLPI